MKSDVEWVDTHLRMHRPQHLLSSGVPRLFGPMVIKAGLFSARCGLVAMVVHFVHSLVWHWRCDGLWAYGRTLDTYHSKRMCVDHRAQG
jgi:hypothetical protein